LLKTEISKSSAQQRKGRAGREGPGTCYRLYPEASYGSFLQATEPEILHCDIASAILILKARDVDNIFQFPLLDRPQRVSFERGLVTLHSLGALNDMGKITPLGRRMAEFPLSPVQSKILIEAAEPANDVLLEVIDILACISSEQIFLTPRDKPADTSNTSSDKPKKSKKKKQSSKTQEPNGSQDYEDNDDSDTTPYSKTMQLRKQISHPSGDHLTLLTILRRFSSLPPSSRKPFCIARALSHTSLTRALDIRKQLRAYSRSNHLSLPPDSLLPYESDTTQINYPAITPEQAERVLGVFCRAMWMNTALKSQDGKYRTTIGGVEVAVHPGSVLHGVGGVEAVMYEEVVWTTRAYMRGCSGVRAEVVGECVRQ